MGVKTTKLGENAYAVSTDRGLEIGIIRLVTVERKVVDENGDVVHESTGRVWIVDGHPCDDYGSRYAALGVLKRLAIEAGLLDG